MRYAKFISNLRTSFNFHFSTPVNINLIQRWGQLFTFTFNSREYQLNPTLGQPLTFSFQFWWISTRSNVGDKLSECKTFTAQFFNFGTACNPSNLFIGISVNNISVKYILAFHFSTNFLLFESLENVDTAYPTIFGDINWLYSMSWPVLLIDWKTESAVSNESDCSSNNEDKYSRLLHWFSIH